MKTYNITFEQNRPMNITSDGFWIQTHGDNVTALFYLNEVGDSIVKPNQVIIAAINGFRTITTA